MGDASNSLGLIISITFGVTWVFEMNGWLYFLIHMTTFLKRTSKILSKESQDILQNAHEIIDKYGSYASYLNLLFIIFPAISCRIPQSGDLVLIGLVVFSCISLTFTAFSLSNIVLRSFILELGKFIGLGNASLESVIMFRRFRFLHAFAYFFAFLVAPSHILFASWPYLRRKYVYFILLIWINASISSICVLVLIMKKGTHKSITQTHTRKIIPIDDAEVAIGKEKYLEVTEECPTDIKSLS